MGRRVLRISPELLLDIFRDGNVIGDQHVLRIESGVPVGAVFVRAWYEGEHFPNGTIVLLLEHELWPEQDEGMRVETIMPFVHQVRLEG